MICRVWHGWTSRANAAAYDSYLKDELLPRVERDLASRGYRGYQALRHDRGDEVEFVTMLWFDSVESVKAFAGENYETPVISQKAQGLLAHCDTRVEHYEVAGMRCPTE